MVRGLAGAAEAGESDGDAIDRTTSASIELRNGVPWIVPNDNVEESAPDDEFKSRRRRVPSRSIPGSRSLRRIARTAISAG